MGRYLAGVASALLLAAAGFFLWTGLAHRDAMVPAPPGAAFAPPTGGAPIAEAPGAADAPQATERTREQKRFDRYDHNRDGKIDRDEYLLARHKNFAKLDTNGDGKLSFEEYAAKAVGKFQAADTDHSGALDAAEFATTRVVRKAKPKCATAAAAKAPASGGEEGDEGQ